MKKFLILFFIFLYLSNIFSQNLNIIFIGSLNGELFGCYCKNSPKAGISRLVYLINKYKNKNSIIVDSGNFLPDFNSKKLIELTFDIYSNIEFSVIGIGENEINNHFWEYKKNNLLNKFISTNLIINDSYYFPYKIIEKNKIKIGFLSIVDEKKILNNKTNFNIINYKDSLKKFISILKSKYCDLIILLSNINEDDEKKILEQFQDINIIISSNKTFLKNPYNLDNRIIVSVSQNGSYIGILNIVKKDKYYINFSYNNAEYGITPEDKKIKSILDIYYKNSLNNNLKF